MKAAAPPLALIPALLLALAAFGCGPSGPASASSPSAQQVPVDRSDKADSEFTPERMSYDEEAPRSSLYEIVEDHEVRVWDRLDEVYSLYPRPKLSFPMTEAPPGISKRFAIKGFESRLGAVGLIGAGGRLVLLLEIQDQADEAAVKERVRLAIRRHGLPTSDLSRGQVHYWFWDDGMARKMICASPDPSGRICLAMALGHPSLMTALRMSPGFAQQDMDEAAQLLARSSDEGLPLRHRR